MEGAAGPGPPDCVCSKYASRCASGNANGGPAAGADARLVGGTWPWWLRAREVYSIIRHAPCMHLSARVSGSQSTDHFQEAKLRAHRRQQVTSKRQSQPVAAMVMVIWLPVCTCRDSCAHSLISESHKISEFPYDRTPGQHDAAAVSTMAFPTSLPMHAGVVEASGTGEDARAKSHSCQ